MNTTYFKLFLSAFFWGGSAIAGKFAMAEMTPALTTFLRFFSAALFIGFIVLIKRDKLKTNLSSHIRLMALGFTGISLCYFFYFKGLHLSSAFNAGLIEATIPIVTLIISIAIRQETADLKKFTGFLIAYIGVAMIVMKTDGYAPTGILTNHGDLLLIASTICFGIYNVMLKHGEMDLPFLSQLFYIFLYGSFPLFIWAVYAFHGDGGGQAHNPISYVCILSMVFMSVGGSALAYIFFNQGIQKLGSSSASSFINMVPFITMAMAITILGETPSAYQWAGVIVLFLGIKLSNSKTKREADRHTTPAHGEKTTVTGHS